MVSSVRIFMVMIMTISLSVVSCSPVEDASNSVKGPEVLTALSKQFRKNNNDSQPVILGEYFFRGDDATAEVAPSECNATEFGKIQFEYLTKLAGDPIAMESFDHYLYLNHFAAIKGIGGDYFGPNGEYTRLVFRLKRDLERFWNMYDINVYGQHNETLNDYDKLTEILWYLVADVEDKEDLYPFIEEIMEQNALSENLPESPIFSGEAFASQHSVIVLGDGLLQIFIETGIDPEVAWAGILSHEWAHQIQIQHLEDWYPEGYFQSSSEKSRTLELEADFLSSYYLTHKRGGTYNWKKIDEFLKLFFQAGDCAFNFANHHGTPLQRMAAANAGYELADSQQKKGEILTAEELHRIFINSVLPAII